MEKLKKEYLSSGWHPDYALTARDSREVYGHRYENEKRNHDWLVLAGAVVVVVAFAVLWVWVRG